MCSLLQIKLLSPDFDIFYGYINQPFHFRLEFGPIKLYNFRHGYPSVLWNSQFPKFCFLRDSATHSERIYKTSGLKAFTKKLGMKGSNSKYKNLVLNATFPQVTFFITCKIKEKRSSKTSFVDCFSSTTIKVIKCFRLNLNESEKKCLRKELTCLLMWSSVRPAFLC